jgi:hypothetical protein
MNATLLTQVASSVLTIPVLELQLLQM